MRREGFGLRVISFLGWVMIRAVAGTCRRRVIGFEKVEELIGSGRGLILAVWHGRTLLPVHCCRHMGIWAITSLSRDGEIQTGIVSRFGYKIIRGSTARGAVSAALTAGKKLEEGGILAVTPDGPRGPSHEIQDGIVFLAGKTGCPIIPIGVGIQPAKIMKAWDGYALPMPFAKCAIIFGDPISVTGDDPCAAETIKGALNDIERRAQLMVGESC